MAQKLERARYEVDKAEPGSTIAWNRRTGWCRALLETRWEEALKQQRQVEEDHHRFLARSPAAPPAGGPRTNPKLSQSVETLWQAAGTSAQDRKQIIRCLVDGVVLVADKASELRRGDGGP